MNQSTSPPVHQSPVPDLYALLGVPPDADEPELRRAYHEQAARLHPDRDRDAEAAARMADLNAAYAILRDPARRARYDQEQTAMSTHHLPAAETGLRRPYSAEISRANPTLFVFLLDQSGSMKEPFGGRPGASKASGVADAINRMLSNLVIRCSQGETTRAYFEIAILGYGAARGHVSPALGGAMAGREVVSIEEIALHPARIEDRVVKQPDGAGGIVEVPVKFPIWFEAIHGGDTPMVRALTLAADLTERWIARHTAAFPPIVMNLTDGESTDGDVTAAARRLTSLRTDDGAVLLFNALLSSTVAPPVLFPASDAYVPDKFGKQMFAVSSPLTPTMLEYAQRQGFGVGDQARGFVFQADLVDVIRFLDIGTRPAELR